MSDPRENWSRADRSPRYAETVVRGYVQAKLFRKKGKGDVASKLDAIEHKVGGV